MPGSSSAQVVRLEKRGNMGIIVIDNPPINAGSRAVRQGLLNAIGQVDADPRLIGGVIIGAGKMFMAGSDIREFGAPLEDPQLPAVIGALETSAKPFAAAIAGAALGGGYELSLGCDVRVASPDAVVGLPETTLGIIPGAGGTQRLPRLVGCVKAVELICAGTRVKAEQAVSLGMIDAVAREDLLAGAIAALVRLAPAKRRVTEMPVPPADPAALEKAKAAAIKAGRGRPYIHSAIRAIVSCGQVPVQDGLAAERAEFQRLRVSREAAALRHLFFAERNAGKIADLDGVAARPVKAVAVMGGGTMGSGIACAMLDAGKSVTIFEQAREAAELAKGRVRKIYQGRLDRGRIDKNAMDASLARLTVSTDISSITGADAIIEAVFEDITVKRDLFAQLGRIAKPDALLLTNTSYLSVSDIAQASGRPQLVAGLHFFAPAEIMRLVEVVRHPSVDAVTIATAIDLAKAAGKLPVVVKDAFGFVGNRIYSAYRRQCEFMLEEGALPEDIDTALETFGFAMGPFAVSDMSGLDIAWRMRKATATSRDPAQRYVRIADMLCDMGRLGRKTGTGYYRYEKEGGPRQADPVVTQVIELASKDASRVRRIIPATEIVERALAAMASEAALLIEERVASNPSDVDLVLANGYGFPRHEGGVLFWAQNQPKADLEAALERLARVGGPGFRVGSISALRSD